MAGKRGRPPGKSSGKASAKKPLLDEKLDVSALMALLDKNLEARRNTPPETAEMVDFEETDDPALLPPVKEKIVPEQEVVESQPEPVPPKRDPKKAIQEVEEKLNEVPVFGRNFVYNDASRATVNMKDRKTGANKALFGVISIILMILIIISFLVSNNNTEFSEQEEVILKDKELEKRFGPDGKEILPEEKEGMEELPGWPASKEELKDEVQPIELEKLDKQKNDQKANPLDLISDRDKEKVMEILKKR